MSALDVPWMMLPPLHAPSADQQRLNRIIWAISTLRMEAAAIRWDWPCRQNA